MGGPGEPGPEGGARVSEVPLTLQLAKESQLMISKLKELKLDESSAPGMMVFGENGSQIAILFGKLSVPETPDGQEQTVTKGKHLVISPKGFFLAEGRSDLDINEDALYLTLKDISKKGQLPEVSIDMQEGHLKIDNRALNGAFGRFNIERVDSDPEQFKRIVKSAILNSREIAQKPLLKEIAGARAGNAMLADMIQQEKLASSQPPGSPEPAA